MKPSETSATRSWRSLLQNSCRGERPAISPPASRNSSASRRDGCSSAAPMLIGTLGPGECRGGATSAPTYGSTGIVCDLPRLGGQAPRASDTHLGGYPFRRRFARRSGTKIRPPIWPGVIVADDAERRDAAAGGARAPARLEEFVGQAHLLGAGSALRTAIEQGHPHSMVLYGPPGSGKTTLARIVAERSGAAYEELSAVAAGRAEVRAVIERAAHRRDTSGGQTVLFLDEIHRFNKAQQDALLPAVEEGLVTLIGATTENPAFEVNGALLSRLRVYALQALTPEEVGGGAAPRRRRRCGRGQALPVEDGALEFLAARSEGDARTALERARAGARRPRRARRAGVSLARVEDALQRRAVLYDKEGDRHYDYISAWIKATRGSDPDASLYYLAVMLEGGEDPRFIVRRMMILASEDIGNADPARAVAGDRRRAGGRARRAARSALRAGAGRDLPGARAEVRRRRARAVGGPAPRSRARRGRRAGAGCAPVRDPGQDARRLRQSPPAPRPPLLPGAAAGEASSASASTSPTRRRRAGGAPAANSPGARRRAAIIAVPMSAPPSETSARRRRRRARRRS